jgi:type I restriction enzyme S subunit
MPSSNILSSYRIAVQPIHAQREILERKNTNLRTTRDLLLPKLISGELDVRNMPEPETEAA